MAAQIVTLGTTKYQLIPLEGTKAPVGVETIKWHDGKMYILSPVTPAPAKTAEVVKGPEPVKTEEKSPVKTETKVLVTSTSKTPSWVWLLLVIGLLVIALLAYQAFKTPAGGNVVNDPTPVTNSANTDVLSESTQLDFGAFGAYHAVKDSNRNMWTLGFWNESIVRAGTKNLADLKHDGGSLSFIMPFDGWINNSAGELFVDGTKWDLGNYGEDPQEATLIKKGQTVTVSYGPGNDSAGFQLWFK